MRNRSSFALGFLALIAVGTAVLIHARRNAHAVAEDEENAEEEQENETEK